MHETPKTCMKHQKNAWNTSQNNSTNTHRKLLILYMQHKQIVKWIQIKLNLVPSYIGTNTETLTSCVIDRKNQNSCSCCNWRWIFLSVDYLYDLTFWSDIVSCVWKMKGNETTTLRNCNCMYIFMLVLMYVVIALIYCIILIY